MSDTKFTKGPWHVYNNDVYLEINSDSGSICDACISGHQFDDGNCTEGVTAKANAHLIAAAPEMYAELEFIRHYIQGNRALEFQNRIDNLIAKARGEHER